MAKIKAIFRNAWPYQKDKMNLPVKNLDSSIPFYETVMGFKILERKDLPSKSAILYRDNIQIGLAENGGDPSNDGCFFEVDNINNALEELKSNGLEKPSEFKTQKHGETTWTVFFIIAPDELCYCIGEKQNQEPLRLQ
jgi:catechol 2,3-dioxygenase-like lactoylglutathione lyase family enzyme